MKFLLREKFLREVTLKIDNTEAMHRLEHLILVSIMFFHQRPHGNLA